MAISQCCCCFDLLKGVKILGKVSLFLTFTAAAISMAFKLNTGRGSYYKIIGAISSIIVDLLLIHACNEKRKACYFHGKKNVILEDFKKYSYPELTNPVSQLTGSLHP
jgi:hypothetical protein